MPSIKKTNPAPPSSNVHPLILAPVRVQPPADWLVEGKFGHMAFEAGEAGRLVRLADVLRWLQSSREIPRSDAVKVLCDSLPADVMGWLYWVEKTAFATPVPATCAFGFSTAEQIAASKIIERQNNLQAGLERDRQYGRFGARPPIMQSGRISFSYPEPTEPGLPALLKYLRGWWVLSKRRGATCDVLDDLKIRYAATLAIRLDKAHALWGYGGAAAMSKPATAPATLKDWTGEQLAAQRAVFVAEGHRAPIKRLAEETGLKDREIRRRIAAHEKPTSVEKKAGPYSQLIVKKPGNKR